MFMELILVGNVGRDPELRYTDGGSAVCDFSLATNRSWKDRDGNRQSEVTWWRVTVWGQQAEIVNTYVKKGRQVLVIVDRIEANAYSAKDGTPQASLDVTARTVRFLGGRDDDDGDSGDGVLDMPF